MNIIYIIFLNFFILLHPAWAKISPQEQQRGQQIYHMGDAKKKITACIACHSPTGSGNARAGFPRLSGQHAEYTIHQLEAFKLKRRSNDVNGVMRDITRHMSPEDIRAVALYIQSLPQD
ncbi:MAG: cytochrome c [Legionellaceae bacterium]|nr:cytochrome c [Legionellaceae bacterium]